MLFLLFLLSSDNSILFFFVGYPRLRFFSFSFFPFSVYESCTLFISYPSLRLFALIRAGTQHFYQHFFESSVRNKNKNTHTHTKNNKQNITAIMKWSTSIALAVAPLAMAANSRMRSAYPVSPNPRAEAESELDGRSIALINGMKGHGINLQARSDIIIIWANPGNNAKTTTINQQVTVTRTVTAGAGEATAVPVAGGGTTTVKEGQTATVPATGASHTVKVGGPGGLVFQPDQMNIPAGDTVVFEFLSQNHTVTQSPFDTPCKALEGGMDSGFLANPNNTVSPPPQVAMQVMATTPLCKSKSNKILRSTMLISICRVLLQAKGTLRQGHGFLHQPDR